MKNKAAVYFRCSTDKQDKSIGDQRRVLEEYAVKKGMQITTWFDKDEGLSGTSFEKRPDFMRMVRMVESRQNDFQKVLVYDVDRWGRPIDPDEASYWEFHLKRFGVNVLYVSDESVNDNTLAGRLTKKIKQELATEESRKQSLRVRERSKMRAAEGFRVGGFAPYGYKRLLVTADKQPIGILEDGERKFEKSQRVILVPGDASEIEVIKRIFSLRMAGLGYKAIANKLTEMGIPSPNGVKKRNRTNIPGKWRGGSVYNIIRNPVYKGDWRYNRQMRGSWVKREDATRSRRPVDEQINCSSAHKGIIDSADFDKVQNIRRYDSRDGNAIRFGRGQYLLSGLIKCDKCGYNFQGHIHKNNYGEWRYYEDGGFYGAGPAVCESFHIPKELIENFVIGEIKTKVLSSVNLSRLEGLIDERLRQFENRTKSSERISELQSQLMEIERKLDNIKDSIEQGMSPEFMKERVTRLQMQKESLLVELKSLPKTSSKQIDRNQVRSQVIGLLDEFEDAFRGDSLSRQKELVQAFIHHISVDPTAKKATCYINKLPVVKVNLCRRSDLNRHDVAIGGF